MNGLRHGHDIPLSVGHRQMGGMPGGTTIGPGVSGIEIAGALQVDLPPSGHGVELGDQATHRDVHEGRVAEVFKTVGKGNLQRLREHMDGGRSAKAQAGDIKLLQDIEHLDDMDPAGTGRADGHDLMPAITPPYGLPAFDVVAL